MSIPAYFPPIVEEMVEFMQTAWPELGPKQILTSIEIMRYNLTSNAQRGLQDLANAIEMPCAIFWDGEARAEPKGIGNRTLRMPCAFYYVDLRDDSDTPEQITLANKIWDLQQLIDYVNGPFTSCQRIEYGNVNSGASLPENFRFLQHRGTLQSACLSYDPGFLVGYIGTP